MGQAPGDPAAEEEGPGILPAAVPDLAAYVDLVSELEEILRGAASEQSPAQQHGEVPPESSAAAEPMFGAPTPDLAPSPSAPDSAPPRTFAPLRARARHPQPAGNFDVEQHGQADDAAPPVDRNFWQVDDNAWAAAPAWREPRRTRGADLFIIGALIVLIAGGGAYSAFRFGGDTTDPSGELLPEASRAEAGLGVPFAPVGRAALLRDDPTAPLPSLEAAVTGPEVTPLPVIVEAPVEVTQPVFLADAANPAPAETPPPPAALDAGPAVATTNAVGGPLVPFEPATAEAGIPVSIVTTVTTWVNMRAGPDNGEPVVIVVAPDTPVTVRACDYWCSVTANGQSGYIFRDFLVALP